MPRTPSARPRRQPRRHRLHARVVEAHAVDHRAVLFQAEQARLRVAGLRARRDAADLDKAETEATGLAPDPGVLVEAGRQTDGICKAAAERRDGQARIVRLGRGGHQIATQCPEREVMGAFGIEPPQNGLYSGINVHYRRPPDCGRTYSRSAISGQIAVDLPIRPQITPANGQNTHLYRWTYLYLCAEYFQVRWEVHCRSIEGASGL